MGLFSKKKSKQRAQLDGTGQAYGSNSYAAHDNGHHSRHNAAYSQPPPPVKPFKYAPHLSKKTLNVGGLPVYIYGLEELTPASSRALAPDPPEVCVAIHMHGRTGSADNEEKIVRQLWDRVDRSKRAQGHARAAAANGHGAPVRELIFVAFDARNHGHRKTSELGQKGWKEGNESHAIDLYSMIVGTAHDISFLIDFLPSYLFPHDERTVSQWVITGKSLGGHAAWHVLANEPRVQTAVPFISCPSYEALMRSRAPSSFVAYAPPHVPHSLANLIASIDPASRPFDVADPAQNPFWGKRICMCSGRQDKLVPWRCANDFVRQLVVAPPHIQKHTFRVFLQDGVGHEVTEEMIEEGGHFIFLHAIQAS